MKIFVPVVGQTINIGDTLHRKILISWLKSHNIQLHIYVGKSPQSFIDALKLQGDYVMYSSLGKWLLSLVFLDFFKKKFLIFNPGEITFSNKRLLKELLLVPFYLYVKFTGGKLFRIGVAAESNIEIRNFWLWNQVLKLTDKVYWRTNQSCSIFKFGKVIPDLAFFNIDKNIDFENKNFLAISMRGDRNLPSEKWFNSIYAFASDNNLKIVVVSQVKIDNERTIEIADRFNATSYIWSDNYTHNQQEEIVNKIYRKAKIAISDRLHVLIAAYTKGVIPVNISVEKSDKVQDHFDVLPIKNITLNEQDVDENRIYTFLNEKLKNTFDVSKMNEASERLDTVKNEILAQIK